MQLFAKRGLVLVTATGSLALSGFGVAFAEANTGSTSSNPGSVGSGNNVNAAVNAPVTVCANGVAVLGFALAGDCLATGPRGSASSGSQSSNPGSVGSGNNVNAAVNAPVTVCGNAVGGVIAEGGDCPASSGSGATGATAGSSSQNDDAVGSGNNVNPVVNAPVLVCGNGVAVLGVALAGDCGSAGGSGASSGSSSHNPGSVGSGNNVNPVVNAPVLVCGNGVAGGGVAVPDDCPVQGVEPDPDPNPISPVPPGPGEPATDQPPGGPAEPEDDDRESVQRAPLAHTGASGWWIAMLGAAFVAGGLALYRRFHPRSAG
ncbi:chaplin family protein [Carbonactinospora thermoautotrophica]|uniref:chaplin family protein n=1 Tax=Carbonactinospora thermoautotrophica TaxID=1469144 RepID=UPI00082F3593|nr:chaplin family protein [Carbonactinospora thermoautotrophica]